MLVVLLGALVGIVFDHRIITGMPAWVKPAKFAISISVYDFTLLWFLHFLQGHKRLVSFLGNGIALALGLEMLIIAGQVIRGTTSHFNFTTPFDSTLYIIMAGAIVTVFLLAMVVAILLLRERTTEPVLAWSLRLGLLLSLIGMFVAFLMTTAELQRPLYSLLHFMQPNLFPLAKLPNLNPKGIVGAHTVGLADGGPGIPFVGWSTIGGDLRIPHFVGLHALQVLPLLGWWISRRRSTLLRMGHRVALIWTAGLGYLGLIGLLTWQALRAQPLLAPDVLTLQMLGGLLAATALAVITIVTHARVRTA
jgi:hypothetical protein